MLRQKDRYAVGVVGATGAVGREMVAILHERGFPAERVRALASDRSLGRTVEFGRRDLDAEVLSPEVFDDLDIALFSAGAAVSRDVAPEAARLGCVVIDNSSAWRRDPDVPLVVPEVNAEELAHYARKGIVANPNCSTIQLVVALKPLADAAGLRRVTVATYQSLSGAGQRGMNELDRQSRALLNGLPAEPGEAPHPVAFNCVPRIGDVREDGFTEEEVKLVFETQRILGMPRLEVCPTAVRVPVFAGHGEAVTIETVEPLSPQEAREILADAHGVTVQDDPAADLYPTPQAAVGRDDVFVGRIRADLTRDDVLTLWIVADNLRKGAALNAVQIAELLVRVFG